MCNNEKEAKVDFEAGMPPEELNQYIPEKLTSDTHNLRTRLHRTRRELGNKLREVEQALKILDKNPDVEFLMSMDRKTR